LRTTGAQRLSASIDLMVIRTPQTAMFTRRWAVTGVAQLLLFKPARSSSGSMPGKAAINRRQPSPADGGFFFFGHQSTRSMAGGWPESTLN